MLAVNAHDNGLGHVIVAMAVVVVVLVVVVSLFWHVTTRRSGCFHATTSRPSTDSTQCSEFMRMMQNTESHLHVLTWSVLVVVVVAIAVAVAVSLPRGDLGVID